jgi:DMSO/TMAO reductase YedYZ heme-binding membrane subunit
MIFIFAQEAAESTKLWWHISRASGIVGWALAALAVLWGVALATRALGKRPPAPWLLAVHRFLGALCIVFVAVHMGSLALDPFVTFRLDDLFVPMASDWKPLAVAWGIVAFYLLLAVELTSLVRNRIPNRLWHWVHLGSYAIYVLATVHLLTAGTDRTNPILLGSVLASIAGLVFFLGYRFIGPGRAASVRSPGRAPAAERTASRTA